MKQSIDRSLSLRITCCVIIILIIIKNQVGGVVVPLIVKDLNFKIDD